MGGNRPHTHIAAAAHCTDLCKWAHLHPHSTVLYFQWILDNGLARILQNCHFSWENLDSYPIHASLDPCTPAPKWSVKLFAWLMVMTNRQTLPLPSAAIVQCSIYIRHAMQSKNTHQNKSFVENLHKNTHPKTVKIVCSLTKLLQK